MWLARRPRSRRGPAAVASALLVTWLLAAPASAQDTGGEEAAAQAEMERELARLDEVARGVADSLDVYLTHPDRREVLEGVVLKDGRAEVWVLRPLTRNVQSRKCEAYRWLLTGRLSRSVGVRRVFEKFPELTEVTLVFYQVATELDTDGRGGYVQQRSAVRHLELTVSRQRALSLDPEGLERALAGDRERCIDAGEQVVDHHWYIK